MEVVVKNASVEHGPLSYIGGIAGTSTGKEGKGDLCRRALVCFRLGHRSVFEHVSLTWGIRGVSRALTHQLVRHRMASYTQQSQRYVEQEFGSEWYVTPPTLEGNAKFIACMQHSTQEYEALLEAGIPAEDARYVLPNAAKTDIVVTMNLREFMHFYKLRSDLHAQWEIRDLAHEMLQAVRSNLCEADEEWVSVADLIAQEGTERQ